MASIDSGVETSNDSNDSSATTEQQSHGTPASKSKEVILYQVPPLITCPNSALVSNSLEAWMADADRRTGEETLHFRCPILPTFSALPLSANKDYLFASDYHERRAAFDFLNDSKRNNKGSYKIRRTKHATCGSLGSTFCGLSASRSYAGPFCEYNHLSYTGPFYERKLRVAVMSNNIELVHNLLSIRVNPNCRDSHRRTPLHLAACRGYADIVRLLLENNADPNQRDLLGNTPLHLAACTNNVVVVTLLLKAGTDVKSTDDYGRNPLQIAQSKLKLLQKLFANDISAHIKNQVYQIIEMLREFLNRRGQDTEAELINSFSSRLTLSRTKGQVEQDVRDLLASLPHLSLDDKKSNSVGESSNDSSTSSNSSATDASAHSLVPAIDTTASFGANKESRPFSLRSAWWAPSIDAMCNCNLETCRACRNKAIFSVSSCSGVSTSDGGFEPLME